MQPSPVVVVSPTIRWVKFAVLFPWGGRGRGFESRQPDLKPKQLVALICGELFFFTSIVVQRDNDFATVFKPLSQFANPVIRSFSVVFRK